MLKREKGWAFEEDGDIWRLRETHYGLQYVPMNHW